MSIAREDMAAGLPPDTDPRQRERAMEAVTRQRERVLESFTRQRERVLEEVTCQREREAEEARDRLDAAKDAVNTDTHFVQPKISGYRQLTPADTLLINEATALGNQMMDLHKRIVERAAEGSRNTTDHDRYTEAEPHRWAAIG